MRKPTIPLIRKYCLRYERKGGALNDAIDRAFSSLPDITARAEVKVKVALLNTLYRTGIQNIDPIADLIVKRFSKLKPGRLSFEEAARMVDRIAHVKWTSRKTGKEHERLNLSFASKFMHFHFDRQLPIYDRYVWLLITAYLRINGHKCKSSPPQTYVEFLHRYDLFQRDYDLTEVSYYDLDKFLWMYGKELYENSGAGKL